MLYVKVNVFAETIITHEIFIVGNEDIEHDIQDINLIFLFLI